MSAPVVVAPAAVAVGMPLQRVVESKYVQEALQRRSEETTVHDNFARIFHSILKPEVIAAASSGQNAGTCTINGDPVISLEQYILRLASVGIWEIDPMDDSSLIPKDYKSGVRPAGEAFPPGSAAFRLLAFTNQFLTSRTYSPTQTQLIKTKLDLQAAFNEHARQQAGGVLLENLGKSSPLSTETNFFSAAPLNVADGWRIVRYREVTPTRNAWRPDASRPAGTVVANVQLTLATPTNETLDLLFADKDTILYCQIDGGESVRYPLCLPTPGLEPVCPDQSSARLLAVQDLVDLIAAKVNSGAGRWQRRGDSFVAVQPARDGIPVLQIAGLPMDIGATGAETSNHGNFVLIGIKELQPALGSAPTEKTYILSLGYLGERITTTQTPESAVSVTTTTGEVAPGTSVTTASMPAAGTTATNTQREVIVISEQRVFGDRSLLVYACPYL